MAHYQKHMLSAVSAGLTAEAYVIAMLIYRRQFQIPIRKLLLISEHHFED